MMIQKKTYVPAGTEIGIKRQPVKRPPFHSSFRLASAPKQTKYAPMIPEIAPLAPIIGVASFGSMQQCATPPATPDNRYRHKNRKPPRPASNDPKNNHSVSMFPTKCHRSACRN